MKDLKKLQRIMTKLENRLPLSPAEEAEFEKLREKFGIKDGAVMKKTALAELLGVDRDTIADWVAEGMPTEAGGGFDPVKVLEWHGVALGVKSEDMDDGEEAPAGNVNPKVYWETSYRKFKSLLAKIEYHKARGKLIERDQVEEMLVGRIIEFKKALLGRGRRLSLRLANKDASEVNRILDEDAVNILSNYSRPGFMAEHEVEGDVEVPEVLPAVKKKRSAPKKKGKTSARTTKKKSSPRVLGKGTGSGSTSETPAGQ